VAEGSLADRLEWSGKSCVAVVLAAQGYPESPRAGDAIEGLERLRSLEDVHVFQAGTRESGSHLVTAGGRVLTVSAIGDTRAGARRRAYEALACLRLQDGQWRRDIGEDASTANLQENR
jgi:phosphoribosylamine--glycine ligase